MIEWRDWLLTAERVAIHRESSTVVVADLHLGYSNARRRAGEAVPLQSLELMLAPLNRVLLSLTSPTLVVAGELFEKSPDQVLIDELTQWIDRMKLDHMILVPGNHDRGVKGLPERIRVVEDAMTVGTWKVHHGDAEPPVGSILQGHLHPGLRVRGTVLPCFLARKHHLILPAFSNDARGVDISRTEKWNGYRCFAIGGKAILDVGELRERGESLTRGQSRG